MRATVVVIALAIACDGGGDSPGDTTTFDDRPVVDADGDGVAADDGDCADTEPAIRPGLAERCDDVDQDCDGAVDEGTADADGDGLCDARDPEGCDGGDDDGDGLVDEGFPDVDVDGIADCVDVETCDGLDDDGDAAIDEGFDLDGDGTTACGGDCDDDDPLRGPEIVEDDADGHDDDCDGYVDEGAYAVGDLVITEILADPLTVADSAGEWFEVLNASDRDVPLAGLAITDDQVVFRVPDHVAPLSPGDYAVFGASADPARNGGVAVAVAWTGLSLGNDADRLTISVEQADGPLIVDAVAWDGAFPRGAGAWSVDPTAADAASNDAVDAWCVDEVPWRPLGDGGSPGAANPACVSDGDEAGPAVTLASIGDSDSCGRLAVRASLRADADLPVSIAWSVAPPSGSSFAPGDLDVDGQTASLSPDMPGEWSFTATATDDDGEVGPARTLAVAVSAAPAGDPPVAEAGANVSREGTTRCANGVCPPCGEISVLLDGTATADPDGDRLTFAWSVTSGWGLLSDPSAIRPSLAVAGPIPTPGQTAVRTVFVELRVRDCTGLASAADLVAITYSCAGQ